MADMTKEELMAFVEQIFKKSGNIVQETAVLRQLKSILEEEQADISMVNLVDEALKMTSDFNQDAKKNSNWSFTYAEIEVVKQRVEQRKRWEAERMAHGRCC